MGEGTRSGRTVIPVEGWESAGKEPGTPIGAANTHKLVVHLPIHLGRPLNIVPDEEVQVAIPIEIKPGSRRGPSRRRSGQATLGGNICEMSLSQIPEQAHPPESGQQHVGAGIAIQISAGHSHAVKWDIQAGSCGDVGEANRLTGRSVVPIQGRSG